MSSNDNYLLGRTAEELHRLARQAALIEPETEDLFRRSGISAGMNVLEIGSGAGDVAMLVGRIVGPIGSVLGIERSADSATLATERVAAAGNLPVRFEVADLDSYTPRGRYDALVGRFVLPYLADPSATLRHLASYLNPGGVVAFLEFDVTKICSVPEGPLFRKVSDWMTKAFSDKINPSLGSALGSVFHDAGLPWPQMMSFQKVCCGPDGFYWLLAETTRAVLPHIVRLGLAASDEVDIDTLEARLREEAVVRRLTVFSPRWVSAWTKLPRHPASGIKAIRT
ncbi:methyltransferase domain-containing protein [Nordella sp. HKS 07]|uniref:methyltransferase domain-containing protein n=1 Tax=Nordella sp. HKS 07 TaxID=2712222 RepID=UPI0013E10A50|nr:methyltransferase domain-containing protein [Nordella sp. HKS 07]QIG48554.1 methyltransferase domain-containing protein [Nordella sp. HKS 07]